MNKHLERRESQAPRALLVVATLLLVVALLLGVSRCSRRSEGLPPVADDYVGADGTLMGVPQGIGVYQCEDHDTREQYFVVVYGDSVAICHREGV